MMLSSCQEIPLQKRNNWTKKKVGIAKVSLCDPPSFACGPVRARGAKGKGLRYEAHVLNLFESELEPSLWVTFPRQWLEFQDSLGDTHYSQPDLFAIAPGLGRIVLVEVKLSRVAKAWHQLRKYESLLRHMFPEFGIVKLEVASKVYAVDIPEKVRVVRHWQEAQPGRTSFLKVPYGR